MVTRADLTAISSIGAFDAYSIISKLFNYNYNKGTKTLKIDFKIDGNGYGTGNSVLVFLSGNIKNSKNEQMGTDVKFGFMTK